MEKAFKRAFGPEVTIAAHRTLALHWVRGRVEAPPVPANPLFQTGGAASSRVGTFGRDYTVITDEDTGPTREEWVAGRISPAGWLAGRRCDE